MEIYNEEDGGIVFDPYDDELIKYYLIPKLRGEDCGDFIVMKDVYAKEPWLLDHTNDPFFKKNEWYYFATRAQVSQKNTGRGRKSKRMITGDCGCGSWKANAKYDIKDVETGNIIGIKQTLSFNKSNTNNNKKQKMGDGTSCAFVPGSDSSWIMTEYMLPEGVNFQELVLCKIREIHKSKKKMDDNHEAPASYHHGFIPASSSEQQPINTDHQTVPFPSSEQQQPLLCGGSGPEIPHMELLSLTCSAAEIERNREESGKGNMVHQADTLSMIETVPERSSQLLFDNALEEPVTKVINRQLEEDTIATPVLAPDHIDSIRKVYMQKRALIIDSMLGSRIAGEYPLAIHLGVNCFDGFFAAEKSPGQLDPRYIESMAWLSFYIAVKFEYGTQSLGFPYRDAKKERSILKAIGYHLHYPTVKTFVQIILDLTGEQPSGTLGLLCSYLTELSLLDLQCSELLPVLLATACVFFAKFVLNPSIRPQVESPFHFTAGALKQAILILHDLYMGRSFPSLRSIREKYHTSQFACLENIPEEYFP